MEELKLTLPVQQRSQRLLVETDPDRVNIWLKSLPYADMERALSKVVEALYQFNRTPMGAKNRAESLSHYQNSYELIAGYFRGMSHMVDEYPSEFLKLTREMSFAYKILIHEVTNKKLTGWRFHKKIKSYTNLAMHYLGLLLLEHYERYSAIPPHVWHEINQLYHYAEQKGFEEDTTQTHSHASVILDNIEDTYKRICLCALSNPFQLAKGLHWQVFYYLYHYIHLCTLSDSPDPQLSDEQPAIDIISQDKALFIDPDAAIDSTRFLHTAQLADEMQNHIKHLEKTTVCTLNGLVRGAQPQDMIDLLDMLCTCWTTVIKRSDTRYPKVNQLEMYSGIKDIFQLYKNKDPLHFDFSDLTRTQRQSQEQQTTNMSLKWETINTSKGGLCVQRAGSPGSTSLNVGQLVAVREIVSNEQEAQWNLAMVRWVQNSRNKSLGLEYIKGPVQAIYIQQTVNGDENTYQMPALLVQTASKVMGSDKQILCRRGFYKRGKEFEIKIGDELLSVWADTCVQRTAFVEQFVCSIHNSN